MSRCCGVPRARWLCEAYRFRVRRFPRHPEPLPGCITFFPFRTLLWRMLQRLDSLADRGGTPGAARLAWAEFGPSLARYSVRIKHPCQREFVRPERSEAEPN